MFYSTEKINQLLQRDQYFWHLSQNNLRWSNSYLSLSCWHCNHHSDKIVWPTLNRSPLNRVSTSQSASLFTFASIHSWPTNPILAEQWGFFYWLLRPDTLSLLRHLINGILDGALVSDCAPENSEGVVADILRKIRLNLWNCFPWLFCLHSLKTHPEALPGFLHWLRPV